jgi:hypothetical protein
MRAEATRKSYEKRLRHLLCVVLEEILEGSFEERIRQLVDISKKDPDWTVDLLLNVSRMFKERTKLPKDHSEYYNPSSFPNYFKPVKKLFDMNNIVISWKRIYATYPELDNLTSRYTRGWSREEISKMLKNTSDSGVRALILIASSSGVRMGALELDWQDIFPVYSVDGKLTTESAQNGKIVCAVVVVYKGSAEEYFSFITPEAYYALMGYREYWQKRVGRQPQPEDPIFFRSRNPLKKARAVALRERISRVARKSGLRLMESKRRHEVPIMNGFRRFWDKTVKSTASRDSPLSSLIKKEMMMGHQGLTKFDKNYFQTFLSELAEEYLTVVPALTISDEFRLREENERLKKENTEVLELAKEAVDERNKAIETLKRQLRQNDFL